MSCLIGAATHLRLPNMAARLPSLEAYIQTLRKEPNATWEDTVNFPVSTSIFDGKFYIREPLEAFTDSKLGLPYEVETYRSGPHGQCNIWFSTGYVQITTREGATHKLFVKVREYFSSSEKQLTANSVWCGRVGERSLEE
jgi:hypothetical protein